MSIEAMIAEHPQVGDGYNEALGLAVRHSMLCAAICNSCADACLAEPMDMTQCIRLNLDFADVCQATSRVASRRSGTNRAVIAMALKLCIAACETCGSECGRHDNAHCRRCAQMCRECADDCASALASLRAEGVPA